MAENTDFIIHYTGDFSSLNNQLKNFQRLNASVAQKFGQDFANNIKVISQSLDKVKNVPIFDAKGLQTGTQTIAQFSTVFKDATGKLFTFRESVKSANGSLTPMNTTMREGATVARTFRDNLNTLAGRALLTIPIWLGIRSALTGMFNVFKNGIRDILDFDRALQQVKRNLQGTPAEIEANFQTIKKEITDLSIATGVSTESIADAVKRFATIGFSAEDALRGGIEATKLSVVLFADAGDTAQAFARALKLLQDTTDGAKSSQEQFAEAMALTAELEKTNEFNLKDASEALIKFAATAKTAGLSMQQTLVLLATLGTAGRTGAQAGTLLSSSFNALRANLDKLSSELGIDVNPQLDDTFGLLVKVIDASADLAKTDKLGANLSNALADIFGGERGTKTVSSLIALNKTLKENIKILPDVVRFNQDVATVLESESQVAKRLSNSNKEVGKAFVTSLFGAENFAGALKNLVELSNSLIPVLQRTGAIARGTFALGSFGLGNASAFKDIKKAFKDVENINKETVTRIVKEQFKIQDLQLPDVKAKLENLEIIKPEVPKEVFVELEKQLRDRIKDLEGTDANKLKVEAELDTKGFVIAESDRQEIAKKVLDIRLSELRSNGLLESQLLKQKQLLIEQLDIAEDDLESTLRKLDIEKAINEERRLQNRLSSDSVKLFEIAKTEGTETAKAIGDVLSGDIDFASFVRRGGDALEVFKRDFQDLFTSQQAESFFRGDTVPGLEDLRGGAGIDIQESFRTPQRFDTRASILASKAEQDLRPDVQIQAIDRNTTAVNALTAEMVRQTLASVSPENQAFLKQNLPIFQQDRNLNVVVTVDLEGRQNIAITTPELLAETIGGIVADKTKEQLIFTIKNNPQDPLNQALNQRTEQF